MERNKFPNIPEWLWLDLLKVDPRSTFIVEEKRGDQKVTKILNLEEYKVYLNGKYKQR